MGVGAPPPRGGPPRGGPPGANKRKRPSLQESLQIERNPVKRQKLQDKQARLEESRIRCEKEYQEYLETKDMTNTDLYVAVDLDEEFRIECTVCRRLIPARAFSSHLSTKYHIGALEEASIPEDHSFIDQYRDICRAEELINARNMQNGGVMPAKPVSRGGRDNRDYRDNRDPRDNRDYRDNRDNSGHFPPGLLSLPHASAVPAPPGPPGAQYAEEGDLWYPAEVTQGEVAYDVGEAVLERFTADTVPVFFAGEEIWETDPAAYKSVQWGILNGVSCEMWENEELNYGTRAAPALGPALVKDRDADTYGVCITMDTEAVRELIKQKTTLVARCASFVPSGGHPHDAVFFEMQDTHAVNMRSMVCKAHALFRS